MESEIFLILLGFLLVLAFLAEDAFAWLRVPPVLVLIGCGLLLGPALKLVPAERFVTVAPHFGALAFLLILFEGGLDLHLPEVLHRLRAGVMLGGLGFLVAGGIGTAVAAAWGLAPERAVVLGLVLAPVSGAIVIPLVGTLRLRSEVRTMLVVEAAVADVLAVLGMGVLVTLMTGGGVAALLAVGSLLAAGFSVLVALAVGLAWPRVLRRLGDRRFVDVLTFGVAMALWGLAELPGASGALAVLVFGLVLANEPELLGLLGMGHQGLSTTIREAVHRLHSFIAQLNFLVRAFFFVFLGVVVNFANLPFGWYLLAVGVVGAFVLARRLLLEFVESHSECGLHARERRALWMLQPRGLVSAVLALEAGHRGLDGEGLFLGVASLVILLTNLLLVAAARQAPESAQAERQPSETATTPRLTT